MPCSVYRWQLRLRAHNTRERAVSYTASDAPWRRARGPSVGPWWPGGERLLVADGAQPRLPAAHGADGVHELHVGAGGHSGWDGR